MENPLSQYLKKFTLLLGDKTEEKRAVQEVVRVSTHVEITLDSILIKNGTITLSLSPIERTEIVLMKKEILQNLAGRGYKFIDLR